MDKNLPDKWIRKAIYDLVNNIVVDGNTIPCYDTFVTGEKKSNYILMTTQTNETVKENKCEYQWNSTILLDIVTRYSVAGNTGSRLLADNIADAVRALTNNIALDVASGLSIIWQTEDLPNDISTITKNENVFRKLIRYEFLIN